MPRNCPSCGRANEVDARFCVGCGAEIASACPSCGAALAVGAVFCRSCGAVIETAVEAAGAAPVVVSAAAPAAAPKVAPTASAPPPASPGGPVAPAPSSAQGYGPGGPVPPVPPAAQSHGAAGPPRKGPSPALLIVIIVLVVAAAAAAAVFFLILPDGSQDGHSETPTPIASSSHTPPSPAAQQYLAAAVGRRGNTLATIAADGTIKELSTTVGEKVFQLAWSPDGTRLACVAGTWERPLLWLYETSSDGVRQIQIPAPALIAIDSVAWLSADELLIAGFTTSTTTGGENGELVVFKPASDSAEPLRNGEGTPLRGIEVSASADGTRVSYVSFVDRTSDQNGAVTATEQLMLLDRDGGSLTMLGTEKAYLDWNDRAFSKPLLAPDGEALICAQTGGDIGCSYKVIDANGTTLMDTERLHLMYPTGYAWDPSSQKVVFTGHTSETGSAIFYVYDRSAGGNAHALTSYKRTYVENLAWSPDGSAIAWGEWDRDSWRTGTLWLTPAGGGDAKRVADWAILPAWAPGAVATLPP